MKDDKLYRLHIIESIDRISSYVAEGKDKFLDSTLIQDAVLRNLQTMAESIKRLADASKNMHPEIAWQEISQFRNVIVHNYLYVDLDLVWQIITEDLPPLLQAVRDMERGDDGS